MKHVLVVGATSAIAEATCRLIAESGSRLCLAGRNENQLASIAADLRLRGSPYVATAVFDANELSRHVALIEFALDRLGGLDTVLIAHGTLPDQAICQQSVTETLAALNTNAISAISLMTLLANHFERQGSGTIAVISSVAGDRGRQSNYVYGTAKAAVTAFAQGLRNRLAASGISVLTIKPGLVDTPMTAAFKKGLLWAEPTSVAKRIYRALERGEDIVYVPWFWRWIMLAIRSVPESLFKRTRL